MGHTDSAALETEIAQKDSYIEYLHDRYISASERLNELIDYLDSEAYGNLVRRSVIIRALRKLAEEL